MADEKLVIPDPGDGREARRPEANAYVGWDDVVAFREAVEELESREAIVDVQARVPEPVAELTVEIVEDALGSTVPQRILQLYSVVDGLSLQWSLREEGETRCGGGFELFNFATVFDHWLGELWPTSGQFDREEEEFLWSLRGFDGLADPERRQMTVFCVEEEYPSYDLFLHDLDGRDSRLLQMDVRTYLDVLLETRGTAGWRPLATEQGPRDERERRRAERFYDRMRRFFPDADLSFFDDR